MKLILTLLLAATRLTAACIPIAGDWVTLRDLVTAIPDLGTLPAETKLLPAPSAGSSRVLNRADFRGMFKEGLKLPANLCVERSGHPLPPEAIRNAIGDAVKEQAIQFEIVESDLRPMPLGRLHFDLRDLRESAFLLANPAIQPRLWPGQLIQPSGQAIPTWALVRVWMETPVWVLDHDLGSAAPVSTADCHIEQRRHSTTSRPVARLEQIQDRVAIRRLSAGTALYESDFRAKPSVVSGQKASLSIVSGQTRLVLEARVSGSARIGETVMVTNPSNGRHLNARVVGEGLLEIHLQ